MPFVLSLGMPMLLSAQPIFRGESVEYDLASKRWFTSDDGTSIIQRDSNGVISYFGSGLKASYGMEVMGNTLFACEGTKIFGYDLTTATQVMQVTVTGSAFLNGLTNDGVSKLYTTCFTNKKIFEIDVSNFAAPTSTEIVSATGTTPNGIVYDSLRHRLIFVNWSSAAPIKAVDLNGFAVSVLTPTSLGNIDGIDDDGRGHYYISSWSPVRISRYDTSFVGVAVTITAPGIYNPADICYAKGVDTLGIPNGNGPVTFIGFGLVVGVADAQADAGFAVYPNPISATSRLQFELKTSAWVQLELTDLQGVVIADLLDEQMPSGRHMVLLSGLNLSNGIYLAHLRSAENGLDRCVRVVVE